MLHRRHLVHCDIKPGNMGIAKSKQLIYLFGKLSLHISPFVPSNSKRLLFLIVTHIKILARAEDTLMIQAENFQKAEAANMVSGICAICLCMRTNTRKCLDVTTCGRLDSL